MPNEPENLIDRRFGRLVAVRLAEKRNGRWFWECRCDCGGSVTTSAAHLKSGNRKSCGCLLVEHNRSIKKATKIPGIKSADIPGYNCWKAMIRRCVSPTSHAYERYGGRGITVCGRWRVFKNFLDDMGPRPSKRHSIERRHNDGPYSPENCFWATPGVQNRNRRNNHVITFRGKTACLADWAAELGIDPGILSGRINRYGWSVERALATPARP